jgi:hypothetical protein
MATRCEDGERPGARRKFDRLAGQSFQEPDLPVLSPLREPEHWLRRQSWLSVPCAVVAGLRGSSSSLVGDDRMTKIRFRLER